MVVSSNEYVAAASLLYLDYGNIGGSGKHDIVTNFEFESIIPSIKNNLFHQRMVDLVNKLELSDKNIKLMRL